MTLTAALAIAVGLAYVGLGTVRFVVATEAVLRYAHLLGIPNHLPEWFPGWVRTYFATIFRMSARVFFLGCAYTHFEIAAHSIINDLPRGYGEFGHQFAMFAQAVGAWLFVAVLTVVDNELREA